MEAGTHSIWISEQLQELGHDVIVANVRELRAISHSDRKSDFQACLFQLVLRPSSVGRVKRSSVRKFSGVRPLSPKEINQRPCSRRRPYC
jgi:hypothetical protein